MVKQQRHLWLLLAWIVLGAGFRFTHLAGKPPWNDEISTLVFSLGNSFSPVPLDQLISLDQLLQPLRPNPAADVGTVIHTLMAESTHPPIYFVLTHLWLQLFPVQADGLVSIWAGRSLSALLGVAAIPALYGLGWFAFRSTVVGHVAALLMAISPFGIYLAQEARHYTLAILLIIASLACLIRATRPLEQTKLKGLDPLPWSIVMLWVLINSVGMAVHYFFALVVLSQGLVLGGVVWQQRITGKALWRLIGVIVGSGIGCLVWVPALQRVPDNQLTRWIFDGNPFSNVLETIGQWLAWVITMLVMLPVEDTPLPLQILFGAVLIGFVLWVFPVIVSGLAIQMERSETQRTTQVLIGFLVGAIALFAVIIYGLGADLTIAARYHFIYFPVILLLTAAALPTRTARARGALTLTIVLGCLGAVTVVSNGGYQKPDRPDDFLPQIVQYSQPPVIIANYHENYEQTREMMGLGLELQRVYGQHDPAQVPAVVRADSPLPWRSPQFLLAHNQPDVRTATEVVQSVVDRLPKPFDLWIFNFFPVSEPDIRGCQLDHQPKQPIDGYKHRLYHCA